MLLPSPQHTAEAADYRDEMPGKTSITHAVAANLRTLLDKRAWTQTELALKSGVSQRHISNVLRQQTGCSIETLDALAGAFGLPGWLLTLAGLEPDLLDSHRLPSLLSSYGSAGPEGRELIDRLAEREAHHAPVKKKVLPFNKRQLG